MRKWTLRLVGLLLLAGILYKVGRDALLEELASAQWSVVGWAALLCGLHFVVKALRWRSILARVDVPVSMATSVGSYCAGAMMGILTPGRIGELAKAVFVRSWRRDASWGLAFGSVVLDRIIDVAAFAVVAVLGFVWVTLPSSWRFTGQLGAVMLLVAGACASTYVWAVLSYSGPGERVKELVRSRLGVSGNDFFATLKVAVGRGMIPLACWTVLAYALFFASFVLLVRALGSSLPAGVACWGISLASLGAILPISISGIGVRDSILIALFAAWDEPAARVLAISLTYLGVLYLVISLLGVWPFVRGTLDLKALYAAREATDPPETG